MVRNNKHKSLQNKRRSRRSPKKDEEISLISGTEIISRVQDYFTSDRVVLVCGSRSYIDWDTVRDTLTILCPAMIITGDARGADMFACIYAHMNKVPLLKFYANWKEYARLAGFIRNQLMVKQSPDLVVAFYRGEITIGTNMTIQLAKQENIPILEIDKEVRI